MMPVLSHYHTCVLGHALERIFSTMFLASNLVRQSHGGTAETGLGTHIHILLYVLLEITHKNA